MAQDCLNEKVGKFIDRALVTIDPSRSAAEAAKLMKKHGSTSVLVCEERSNRPIGILTERDILYKIVADGKGPYKVTVGEIMSMPLVTIDENSTVKDALELMKSKSIRRLPVVSHDQVIGLLNMQAVVGKTDYSRAFPINFSAPQATHFGIGSS